MTTLKLDPRVQELIGIISKVIGTEVVCAGGAARDALHGREPKDYDLFVLGQTKMFWSGSIHRDLVEAGIPFTRYERDWVLLPYDGEEDTRIDWVMQVEYKGIKVDLIQYSERKEDAVTQVEAFDCTLNMAWFDSGGVAVQDGRFPTESNPKVQNLERVLKQSRVDHLQSKYPQYDYSEMLTKE